MQTKFSLDHLSQPAKLLVVDRAQKLADDSNAELFDPAHLFAVLLDLPDVLKLLKSIEIDTVSLSAKLFGYLKEMKISKEKSCLAKTTISLFARIKENVRNRPANHLDILLAVSQETSGISAVLCKEYSLTSEKITSSEIFSSGIAQGINEDYLVNLSASFNAEMHEYIIGRDKEVRRLFQILGRHSKHHPILVGEAGIGKNTIVLSILERLHSKKASQAFKNTVMVALNTQALLSGTNSVTEVESRIKFAVASLRGYSAILYIRSLEVLLNSGTKLNLYELFQHIFAQKGIRVICSISPDGFKKLTEKESALVKELTVLEVEQTSLKEAVEILRGVASRYEDHHNIKIGEAAINMAAKLSLRYVHDRCLPESAIDLLDEAASNSMMEVSGIPVRVDQANSRSKAIKAQLNGLKNNYDEATQSIKSVLSQELKELDEIISSFISHENEEEEERTALSEASIASVLGAWTNIPASKFLEGEAEKMSKMDAALSRRVVGQDEAVHLVSKAVKRSSMGIRDPGKPIGSFLFLGPSGVGKTEMAKALAEFLFDDETAMTRIDCSELQQGHSLATLIGSPPGYSGSDAGGKLTEAVKKKPYSVVLFDEVEKAHPDIFNVLLQVLDDGRLSDAMGKTVDFSNTIVILTSNIGGKKILEAPSYQFETDSGKKELKDMLQTEVLKFLRPELINRLDATIIFKALDKEQLAGIFDIQLKNLHKMLGDKKITVTVSKKAKEQLVELSYVPQYGARPLKRKIGEHIQDPLTDALINGKYKGVKSTIHVDFIDDNFVMSMENS